MNSTEGKVTTSENELKRGLKARHLNMIAIGGAIGTGIFLALGCYNKSGRSWWSTCCIYQYWNYGLFFNDKSW